MSNTSVKQIDKTWKPIPNFDSYFVSNDGKVMSMKQGRRIVMRPIKQEDGHLYVFLYDGHGNQKKMYVHRLVLMAWVRMPFSDEEGRHLNDIPDDNRLENLAWGSRLENVADKRRNEGFPVGERSGSHKLTDKQVLEVREKYKNGMSSRDIAAEYGVTHTSILKIARGQRWKHVSSEPIYVQHSSAPKTKLEGVRKKDWKKKLSESLKKYWLPRKTERNLIPCSCGCGQLVETPDLRGRERKYIQGHYNYWKHGKNKD